MSEELLQTAVAAAHAGAAVLRRWFRAGDLEVRAKAENDFVTRADRESEAAVVATIHARHPDHGVVGEEGSRSGGGEAGYEWLVDPLDGTSNFIQGLPVFCVALACRRGDQWLASAIFDPEGGNLFTARRGAGASWNGRRMTASSRPSLDGAFLATGYPFRALPALDLYLAAFREVFLRARAIRRCGSASLDLAYTAAGVYDGFFEFCLAPWDLAPGALLVREAGGRVSDLDGGERFLATGNVVAGGAGVQPDLLARLNRQVDEARLAFAMTSVAPAAGGQGKNLGDRP